MINILKSGKDKIFVEKCQHCGTEFSYQLEDVIHYDDNLVECPLCRNYVPVSLRTMEEGV